VLVAIVGAHMLLYTPQAEEVRAVLRDVLGWEYVEDVASSPGWLIFKLPPAELGVHPTEGSTAHEICLMCDNLDSTMSELRNKGVEFRGEPITEGFGIVTTMLLPGGLEMLLYQPTHESPLDL
jgi:glyoxalase/bleomycin resistance protein/dioxygenase superfamily protein